MDTGNHDCDGKTAAVLLRAEAAWAELVELADRIAARRNPPDALLVDELLTWCESARPAIEDYRVLVDRLVAGPIDDMAVLTGGRAWLSVVRRVATASVPGPLDR